MIDDGDAKIEAKDPFQIFDILNPERLVEAVIGIQGLKDLFGDHSVARDRQRNLERELQLNYSRVSVR